MSALDAAPREAARAAAAASPREAAPASARPAAPEDEIILSLPAIHCAGCIGGIERRLATVPGVRTARVNLSRKRATVRGDALSADGLIAALAEAGHEAQPLDTAALAGSEGDARGRALLQRLAVAGFAMMNVMLFSVAVWSGADAATRTMFHWLSAAIAAPALVYSAQVFTASAWRGLRAGALNMDVPISLAIILATGLSIYETATGGEAVYFDAALSLTFFLLVGRYLDHRTRMLARSAAQELTALEDPHALRLEDGQAARVRVAELAVGERIALRPGMRLPVDARVASGRSEIDRSLLTGESLPLPVGPGARLHAGDINLTGALELEVEAVGEDTTLRRMAALVETAEAGRNRYTALADRAARIYAPAVHLLALGAFAGWLALSADVALALNIAISVLIITCPCALGLAVPAVMTAASGRMFRDGMLVKTGTAIERLAEVDCVVFDKTGTLSEGHARLDLAALGPERLSVLAGLARASSHPVAEAIARALPAGQDAAKLSGLREHPGHGISANWQGQEVRLGSGDWLGAEDSPALRIGTSPAVALPLEETLRPGAAESVAALSAAGYETRILSGDTPERTARMALRLGITAWQGGLDPEGKLGVLDALARQGYRVLMIGDGLNDTAALARAHASISPASGLDASRAASDVVLLGRSLAALPGALKTARLARRLVVQNFAIAATYNAIAIPIALSGHATPLGAAIAMSLSSICVVLNALRVR